MSTTPEISGYTFGEQLLDHPLASVWRGTSASGMEVVALVLNEIGAADRAVRDRLAAASRIAAVQPGPAESPLWAANLNATRPYAVTQLAPGYSGAERLLDPLDGVIGNDQSAIEEVRRRLDGGWTRASSPAAAEIPQPDAPAKAAAVGKVVEHAGRRLWAAAIVIPLIVFVVAYSAGAAINSAAARPEPTSPKVPVPDAVQPTPLPSKKVLLPGISKTGQVPLRSGVRPVSLVASTIELSPMPWDRLGLPFAMHIPGPEWLMKELEESSYSIYRQLLEAKRGTVVVAIAAHPCKGLAGCLADRTEFDARWSRRYGVQPPTTARDDQTWFSESAPGGEPYRASLTRAFLSPATRSWWLVGVAVNADSAGAGTAQAILNDIRTQTS
jgi:hypothetical protein